MTPAFSTVLRPHDPVLLRPHAWRQLAATQGNGHFKTVTFACGFRGSDTHVETEIETVDGELFGAVVHCPCPDDSAPVRRRHF